MGKPLGWLYKPWIVVVSCPSSTHLVGLEHVSVYPQHLEHLSSLHPTVDMSDTAPASVEINDALFCQSHLKEVVSIFFMIVVISLLMDTC
jgi:hypothetical protein